MEYSEAISVFWTWQDHYYIHELIAAVVPFTRSNHLTIQHGWGGAHKVSSPAEWLFDR